MSRMLRLTLIGAATMALMTVETVAQTGTAPAPGTAADAPPKPVESQTESDAQPQKRQEPPRSPGCPYRDSTLELIV